MQKGVEDSFDALAPVGAAQIQSWTSDDGAIFPTPAIPLGFSEVAKTCRTKRTERTDTMYFCLSQLVVHPDNHGRRSAEQGVVNSY